MRWYSLDGVPTARGASFSDSTSSLPRPTKQWGLTSTEEGLPPDQKRARLEQQMREVDEDIESEVKSKKGLGAWPTSQLRQVAGCLA